MGGQFSKKSVEGSPIQSDLKYTAELSSYEKACRLDPDLQAFHSSLQERTNHAINANWLLEMNPEVVKILLDCTKDIWKTQELFELVEEYFENSLQTLDFCTTALEHCLTRARDRQLIVHMALQQFEDEDGVDGSKYPKTLEELKAFKAAGDPFTEEFFLIFKSVYAQQVQILEKLQIRKRKLDKKLNSLIPMGKNYEVALKGQKEIISSMQVGTYIAIKDLDNIQNLVHRLEILMESLLYGADFALREEEAVKLLVEDIKKKLGIFMQSIEDLGEHADKCNQDIRRARTVILQRIMENNRRIT